MILKKYFRNLHRLTIYHFISHIIFFVAIYIEINVYFFSLKQFIKISPQEGATIAGIMASDPNKFAASGIHIEGQKYMFLRADETVVYGKKKGEAIVLQKTRTGKWMFSEGWGGGGGGAHIWPDSPISGSVLKVRSACFWGWMTP